LTAQSKHTNWRPITLIIMITTYTFIAMMMSCSHFFFLLPSLSSSFTLSSPSLTLQRTSNSFSLTRPTPINSIYNFHESINNARDQVFTVAISTTDSNEDIHIDNSSYVAISTTDDIPLPNTIPDDSTLSTMSKLEQEFYGMMKDFSIFTERDMSSISNPSYRALYEGVSAGSNEPAVMNAFAIIFNDLLPIRVAGRMIFKHLKNVMEDNIQQRRKEEERVQNETGLSLEAIDYGRKTFMAALANGKASEGTLTMTELIDSGIVEMLVELMEYDSFEQFLENMEQDEDEKINFEKFLVGLQKCAMTKNTDENSLCDVSCDLEEVLTVTAQRLAPIEAKKQEMTMSERKKKYSDRYDEMVKSFEEWEDLVPQGDGRMIQVLTGCFAGAKNNYIVQALKIVYMDYSALRVGGDLVFKLMGKLVNRRSR